jgi:hypothetical protein
MNDKHIHHPKCYLGKLRSKDKVPVEKTSSVLLRENQEVLIGKKS